MPLILNYNCTYYNRYNEPFFMTAQGPLQKIQATVWKMMQGLSWKMLIQLRHPLWLK